MELLNEKERRSLVELTAILNAQRVLWDIETICQFARIGMTKAREIVANPRFPRATKSTAKCRRWWSDEVKDFFKKEYY